jgi:hypothetical protein
MIVSHFFEIKKISSFPALLALKVSTHSKVPGWARNDGTMKGNFTSFGLAETIDFPWFRKI